MTAIKRTPHIGVVVHKYPIGYKGKRVRPHFPHPEAHRRFVEHIFACKTSDILHLLHKQ